jgi:predicted AlkP superfamily phosphohydrolase/phosphomutase
MTGMRTAFAVLGLALVLAACPGSSEPARATPVSRVIVIGVDGLEWKVLRPLIEAKRCPNIAALMERGAFGRLGTLEPALSPVVWTTIATGRSPEEHGIAAFEDTDKHAYTAAQRKCRAVWDIADRYGLSSCVLGWWVTWPVEEIRGAMVSGSSSPSMVDENWKPALVPGIPGQVSPKSLETEAFAIADRAGAQGAVKKLAEEKVFRGVRDADMERVETELIRQSLWSVQSDATFFALAKDLFPKEKADLSLVYFGGPDVIGHRFWRYMDPSAFHWTEERWKEISPDSEPLARILSSQDGMRELADAIPNEYVWIDEMIGEIVRLAGPDATIVVCSDHGMHADSTEEPNVKFVTGHHLDGPPGVLVAAGPGIRRSGGLETFLRGEEPPIVGGVASVAPTLLALLGIPRSLEMKDSALEGILDGKARDNANLPPVATHDEGYRPPKKLTLPPDLEKSFQERFEKLGYVGTEDDPPKKKPTVDGSPKKP